MGHGHRPEEERRIREAALDETLAETFPASDTYRRCPIPMMTLSCALIRTPGRAAALHGSTITNRE
jgi:hypothetical protein